MTNESIREISVDFAHTIANELRADLSHYFDVHAISADARIKQAGEDMIQRYIRRAIIKYRDRQSAHLSARPHL